MLINEDGLNAPGVSVLIQKHINPASAKTTERPAMQSSNQKPLVFCRYPIRAPVASMATALTTVVDTGSYEVSISAPFKSLNTHFEG